MDKNTCMVHREPEDEIYIYGYPKGIKCDNCETCGWNPEVHQQRIEYLRIKGLKKLPNGMYTYPD